MLKLRSLSLFALVLSGFSFISRDACASFLSTISEGFNSLSNNIVQTWNEEKNYDLYIPSITRHARFAYDQEKIKAYNERPWGAGLGISRWDEKENWHGLYLMAFKDSFNKWEPIGGYGWEKKEVPTERPELPFRPRLYPWGHRSRELELHPNTINIAFSINRLR